MEIISNEMIKEHLAVGNTDAIIIGMMPLAKRIGRKSNDEYAEALLCLVEKVMNLHEVPHQEYVKYLSKCMRGVVQTWRANLSVVPIPQGQYRLLRKLGREKELTHEYIRDYHESPELITVVYCNDVFEFVESRLTSETKKTIFRLRVIGATEEEMAEYLKVSRQYVQRMKVAMMEDVRAIIKKWQLI